MLLHVKCCKYTNLENELLSAKEKKFERSARRRLTEVMSEVRKAEIAVGLLRKILQAYGFLLFDKISRSFGASPVLEQAALLVITDATTTGGQTTAAVDDLAPAVDDSAPAVDDSALAVDETAAGRCETPSAGSPCEEKTNENNMCQSHKSLFSRISSGNQTRTNNLEIHNIANHASIRVCAREEQ